MNVMSTTSTTSQDYDVTGIPISSKQSLQIDLDHYVALDATTWMYFVCILMLFLNSIVFRRGFFPSHAPLLYLKVCLPDVEMQQQARNRKGRHSAERAAFQHPARLHLRPHTNSCVSRATKSKDLSAHQTTLKWTTAQKIQLNMHIHLMSPWYCKKGLAMFFCVPHK